MDKNTSGKFSAEDIQHAQKAIAAAIEKGDKEVAKQQGEQLTRFFFKNGELQKAEALLDQLLTYFAQDAPASLYNRMAAIKTQWGDHEAAVKFFKMALDKYKAADNKPQIMMAAHNLGATALKLKDFECYFENELVAYQLAITLKKTRMIFLLGYSLGGFLLTTGKQTSGAAKMLKTSYEIGLKKGYPETGKLELFLREKGYL